MTAHAAELHLPAQIVIAGGCTADLPAVAEQLRDPPAADRHRPVHGRARPGPGLRRGARRRDRLLRRAGRPTTENVADGLAALAHDEADGVIAVGGGSSLDTGKAVAVMARNEGTIGDYVGYHRIPRAGCR